MLDAGVPQEIADDFVAVVETAMGAIDTIEAKAFEVFNSINAVDFSGLEDLVSVNLTSGTATSSENGTPVGIGNIAHVTGTAFDDKISGNGTANHLNGGAGDDWINGGAGADSLLGSGGDDFIFFDAEDGANVVGGEGRDVAVAVGQAGVTVDLLAQGLEVVVGRDGADTIAMGGSVDILFAAGGDGADTFVIGHSETEATRVIWGGGGADTFVFADGVGGGIAVVTVAGLTEEKFASLTIDDLDLGGLNLGAFRAVILNPEASDRVTLNGSTFSTNAMPDDVEWKGFSSANLTGFVGRPMPVFGGYERNYEFEATLEIERDEFENVVSIKDYLGRWLADGTEEFDLYEYDPNNQSEQDEADAFILAREVEPVLRMTDLETNPTYAPSYGGFFVVGGTFAGADLVASGALAATAPDDPGNTPYDWLMVA